MTVEQLTKIACEKGYAFGIFSQDMAPNLLCIQSVNDGSILYSSTKVFDIISWLNDPGEF